MGEAGARGKNWLSFEPGILRQDYGIIRGILQGFHQEYGIICGLPMYHSMDGWMTCDFTSFSTVFQSYQDDGRLITKGCVQ